jgi:hypothetical protein
VLYISHATEVRINCCLHPLSCASFCADCTAGAAGTPMHPTFHRRRQLGGLAFIRVQESIARHHVLQP